jgi:hypothetical protein
MVNKFLTKLCFFFLQQQHLPDTRDPAKVTFLKYLYAELCNRHLLPKIMNERKEKRRWTSTRQKNNVSSK